MTTPKTLASLVKSVLYIISLSVFACLLTSCKTTSLAPFDTTSHSFNQHLDSSASEYLQMAEKENSPKREQILLGAVARLLQEGSHARAKQILANIQIDNLPSELLAEKHLLGARLHQQLHLPKKALQNLSTITKVDELSHVQQILYYDLLARAYDDTNNPLQSIKERIKLDKLLRSAENKDKNRDTLWNTLQHVDKDTLNATRIDQATPEIHAWLDLAFYIKRYQDNPQQLNANLANWKAQYPGHPGVSYLPKTEKLPQETITEQQKIALLLPLHGNLAKARKAVRDGFMSTYFEQQKQQNPLQVKVYDTSKAVDISALYRRAVQEGANFVIGPLNRDRVTLLSRQRPLTAPTLVLNYLDDRSESNGKFYQFGISPKDEAMQIAMKAWQDGKRNAILIAPKNDWGTRITQSFQAKWTSLGGKIVGELKYAPKQKLNRAIKNLLHVDQSHHRKAKLQTILGEKLKFIPRRRQDADMLFLVASPKTARQIRPFLKFYYAGKLSVYANSDVYEYTTHKNKDIDGITFCDIPWLLDPKRSQAAKKQLAPLKRSKKYRYTRLYALGHDSLLLAKRIYHLKAFPAVGLPGATGRLYLDTEGKVRRELQWAIIRNGHAKRLEA